VKCMNPIRRLVLASLFAVLTGCGQWTHPTKSTTDLYTEKQVCERQAAEVYPVVLVRRQTAAGHYTPSTSTCTTTGNKTTCVTTPGRWVPPTWITEDVNQGRRDAMTADCLRAGGWTWKLD